MDDFTKDELDAALCAFASLISKCEKVLPKLKSGSAQASLMRNRIKAFHIASTLITHAQEARDESP